jgi:hypothetical protein
VSAPAVIIRIELEGPIVVYSDALREGEQLRLEDWVRADADRLEIVERALDLSGVAWRAR